MQSHKLLTSLTLPLALSTGLLGYQAGQQGRNPRPVLTPLEREVLSHFSFTTIVDGATGQQIKTLRLSDVNFQIVSGAGSTHVANGAGNLILGYAEDAAHYRSRDGSHNLCLGDDNSWSGTGGLVGGTSNEQNARGGVVLGGFANRVQAPRGVVVAGRFNSAEGDGAVVLAGELNRAAGEGAAVVAGLENDASGDRAGVLAGGLNRAQGPGSACVAGLDGLADAPRACVVAGQNNHVFDLDGAVLGGLFNRVLNGGQSTIVGGVSNEVDSGVAFHGFAGVVVGGNGNAALGATSVVSGGRMRAATDEFDWVAGALDEDE